MVRPQLVSAGMVSGGPQLEFKQLFARLLTATVWGRRWRGHRVQWLCDNQPAVFAVNQRSCRDGQMMSLVRCLFLVEVWFGFEVVASHLPGRENTLEDDLSHNHRSAFLLKAHQSDREPTPISSGLPELLLDMEGWTS